MEIQAVDGATERRVVISCIVDKHVVARVAGAYQKGLLGAKWADLLVKWSVNYYRKHNDAPGRHIQAIFEQWAETNKDRDTIRLIGDLLASLSDEWDGLKEESNSDYLIDLASKHFRKVKLERLHTDLGIHLDNGDLDKANALAETFKQIDITPASGIDVFQDMAALEEAFTETDEVIFTLPGALGEFMNVALERDGFIAFHGPSKRGKCVAEDMDVVLATGEIKTIGQIVKEGKQVDIISYNEKTLRFEVIRTNDLWDNGKKPCYEVVTKSGRRVVTTSNHEYLTPHGWRFLSDIQPFTMIAVPKKLDFWGDRKYCDNKLKFLAYMLADGCCVWSYANRKGRRVRNGCASSYTKNDKYLVADFHKTCKKLGIRYQRKGNSSLLRGSRWLLDELGLVGHSAKTKEIPPFVFTCPKEQVALFLRIFFSSDGWVSWGDDGLPTEVGIALANQKMIRQISHLLIRFGIVHKIDSKINHIDGREFPSWSITIRSQEYISLFINEINMLSYKRMEPFEVSCMRSLLDKIPAPMAALFYEELKNEYQDTQEDKKRGGKGTGKGTRYHPGCAFRRMFGKRAAYKVRWAVRHNENLLRDSFSHVPDGPIKTKYMQSDVLWDEVESITYIGERQTYDLSVPGNHNFVASDCVVHNTYWLMKLALAAVLQRRKVAFFEVGDLSQRQMLKRYGAWAAKHPTRSSTGKWPIEIKYPVMLKRRLSVEAKPEIQFETYQFDHKLTFEEAKAAFEKVCKKRIKSYDSYLKLSTHPNTSISVNGIEGILETWDRDNWTPDVVVVDYADILAPINPHEDKINQVNSTWKALRALSQSRHCLVITASQTNKDSFDAELVKKKHGSENWLKFAHVTGSLGISQTPEEKEHGIQRLSWFDGREFDVNPLKCVYVAGCPAIANPAILSCW